MSLFQQLGDEGLEQVQDRLGGFQPFNTDVYPAKIKAAYAGKSAEGAMSVTVMADIGGKEYRETLYITNKKGENFYLNKQDAKKKVPLPGFTTVNDICLIACEKPLSQMQTEEKIIKLYDYDAKQEVPKPVQMITELIGKDVALGIFRQLENKSTKDSSGKYVATPETREINVIEKVFHPELKLTVAEAQNGKTKGEFWDAWVERNKDTIRDKREIKDGAGGTAGAPRPAPTAQAQQAAPKTSLFKK